MLSKVLVANRGEIAVRIISTLRDMGIGSVAVASEPDADSLHALSADQCKIIGPAAAAESYLNIEAVIHAARETGCDAIHPGYGFLSENGAFSAACTDAGITFIGPPVQALEIMGSKTQSRVTMSEAGVAVVPGFQEPGADSKAYAQAADNIGYPILVKAASGGGGKGMRLVREATELESSMTMASQEAKSAFGDGTVYIEKYIEEPRHIEIQVFADAQGDVFHLGERECSIQRRHQKIIEECPSPFVDEDLRRRMGEAAIQTAKAVDYRGAGTVEFLVNKHKEFYFLEMNTRLQVEHPVTEMVYGVDLVQAQIRTAAGEPLDFDPRALTPRGHAVEARIYAEDPANGFLPQAGPLLRLKWPNRPGLRIDSGLLEGHQVEVHYDPLLAKMIAWGPDRVVASDRLQSALRDTTILGLTTNLDFLGDLLDVPAWKQGALNTNFIEEHMPSWSSPAEAPPEVFALAMEALSVRTKTSGGGTATTASPFLDLGGWRPLD